MTEVPSGWLEHGRADEDLLELKALLDSECPGLFPLMDMGTTSESLKQDIQQVHTIIMNRVLPITLMAENVTVPIRLVWSEGECLNALAAHTSKAHFVLLTTGLCWAANAFFDRLMASPEFMPEIGNVQLEEAQERCLIQKEPQGIVLLGDRVYPNCPVRCYFAGLLSTAAIYFCVMHEVTHLLHGHVAVEEAYLEVSALSPDHENIRRHCMEADADHMAALNLAKHFLVGSLFSEEDFLRPSHPYYQEGTQIQKDMGVGFLSMGKFLSTAIAGLFFLFRSDILTPHQMFGGDHPPTLIRLFYTCSFLLSYLKKYYGVEEAQQDAFINIVGKIYPSIHNEMMFDEQEYVRFNFVSDFVGNGHYPAYMKELVRCWDEELYDILDKRKISPKIWAKGKKWI